MKSLDAPESSVDHLLEIWKILGSSAKTLLENERARIINRVTVGLNL
jgi:hypothetical protein